MKKVIIFLFLFIFCFGVSLAEQVPFGDRGVADIPDGFKLFPYNNKKDDGIWMVAYNDISGDMILLTVLSLNYNIDLDSQKMQDFFRNDSELRDVRSFMYAGKKTITAVKTGENGESYITFFARGSNLYSVSFIQKNSVTGKYVITPFGRNLVFSIVNSFQER